MKAFFLGFLLLLTALGRAHDSGMNGVRIVARDRDTLIAVSGHLSQLERIEGHRLSSEDLKASITRRLRITRDGATHTLTPTFTSADRVADQFAWQATTVAPADSLRVTAPLFPEESGAKTIISFFENGEERAGYVLAGQPSSWSFILLGLQHILTGYDHILFVVGLVLVGGRLRDTLATATAFTLAHSITLACAVLGWAKLSSNIVEPLIALSIVAVAIEGLGQSNKKRRLHAPVAFGFGLIHGFGFAGALQELSLSGPGLGWALGGFNLGVELGQVAVILLSVPLLTLAARNRRFTRQQFTTFGCFALGGIGTFWFVTRLMIPT